MPTNTQRVSQASEREATLRAVRTDEPQWLHHARSLLVLGQQRISRE